MTPKELEGKTLTELKAIVYDLLVVQQDNARELQIVNAIIAQKESEEKKEK